MNRWKKERGERVTGLFINKSEISAIRLNVSLTQGKIASSRHSRSLKQRESGGFLNAIWVSLYDYTTIRLRLEELIAFYFRLSREMRRHTLVCEVSERYEACSQARSERLQKVKKERGSRKKRRNWDTSHTWQQVKVFNTTYPPIDYKLLPTDCRCLASYWLRYSCCLHTAIRYSYLSGSFTLSRNKSSKWKRESGRKVR